MSDTQLNQALDRFDTPTLSAGFVDRVVEAAGNRAAAPTPWLTRERHGGWRRRASIVGGGIAFGLLSAAAAATGYLGEPVRQAVRDAPVIGTIIAQVSPVVAKPKAKPAPVRVAKVKPESTPPSPAIEQTPQEGRLAMAERIRSRMAERRAERAELGLPPQRPRVQLREAIRDLPLTEQQEIVRLIRENRRARMAQRWRMRQERRERWLAERQRAEDAAPPPEGSDELAR